MPNTILSSTNLFLNKPVLKQQAKPLTTRQLRSESRLRIRKVFFAKKEDSIDLSEVYALILKAAMSFENRNVRSK